MTDADIQEATTEALRRVLENSLTAPMTVDELQHIFGLSFRPMKICIGEMSGVEKVGSRYRVPLRHMPPEFIAELQNLTKAED